MPTDEKEEWLINYLINYICKVLTEQHPKLKKIDSNLFHFVIYEVAEKQNLKITRGWFKNGPYCPKVDDILVKRGMMDKSQHQIDGKEVMMEHMIECDCHAK
jgi:hypothetical protein